MPVNTKKILLLSDSHGNIPALTAILRWAKDYEPDSAVFLGDGVADVPKAALAAGFSCEWHMVRGNNDWGSSVPESAVFECGGHTFFICHGHRFGLHWGDLHSFIAAARNNGAHVALFGHTHAAYCKQYDELLLVNPGSISRSRGRIGESFAVIECSPGMADGRADGMADGRVADAPPKVCFLGIDSRRNITELK